MTISIGTKLGLQTVIGVVLIASVGAIRLAAAQQQGEAVSVDVSKCVELTTPEKRLACFEAQVEAAGAAPVADGAAAAGSGTAAADSASRGKEEEEEADAHPPDVVAKVAELREIEPSAYLITLDNGQVWRQTVPQAYGLREGSDVRIYFSSRWRSFRLTNPELRRFIQVERVR